MPPLQCGCPNSGSAAPGADHGDMLSAADGYVTAWLCWQLKGDATAARAFVGEDAEAKTNPLYQDVASNF